jgi:hypothetical protein
MSDEDWQAEFARDGLVVLRGAIPEDRVRHARAAIAASLDADRRAGREPRHERGTFCPDLVRDPAVLALLEPLRGRAATLFGERTHEASAWRAIRRAALTAIGRGQRAQIALRFPDATPRRDPKFGLHLDGYPAAGNGVPRGRIFRSTLLIGAYLTEVAGPDRGNLVVWPGSHRRFARYFRELDAPKFLRVHGAEALLEKIRAFDAGDPVQLEVRPGDAVIAHHLLGHGTADNLSRDVREAVYFRLLHPSDHAADPTPLLDETRFFAGPALERRAS